MNVGVTVISVLIGSELSLTAVKVISVAESFIVAPVPILISTPPVLDQVYDVIPTVLSVVKSTVVKSPLQTT